MAKTVNLREVPKSGDAAAAIEIELQGFTAGDKIELTLFEDDTGDSLVADPNAKTKQKVGQISGEVVQLSAVSPRPPLFSLKGVTAKKEADSPLKITISFRQPDGGKAETVELRLPRKNSEVFEGDSWELFATIEKEPAVVSPTTRVARVRRALSVDNREATYRHYAGHALTFYHDGSNGPAGAAGYFKDLVDAIGEAKDFIFIADWSFHPHMRPVRGGSNTLASTIGAILIDKARQNPSMVIAIHTWNHTNQAAPDKQNDNGNTELDSIAKEQFRLARRPSNVLWQATSRTGVGYSHHQKFVVMDADLKVNDRRRLRAFAGGFDITRGRFDWPDHVILPSDPAAAGFIDTLSYGSRKIYDDWYNAEFFDGNTDSVVKDLRTNLPLRPRQPWHDIGLQISGPACWDVVREFVGRWRHQPSLGGNIGDKDAASLKTVLDRYLDILKRLKDPAKPHNPDSNPLVYAQHWHPSSGIWTAQVLRSMKKEHWEDDKPQISVTSADHTFKPFEWTLPGDTESSILQAYLRAIGQAEEFIYIETQYFISSGNMWGRARVSNTVAQALADRAIERARAGKPFHIYLVVPMFPEGSPGDSPNAAQRQFQWNTIRTMATRIQRALNEPHSNFLSVFFIAKWHDLNGALPNTGATRAANVVANKRYQIYVHSKFMLIDDRYMIIGSANLNERSVVGGRDSEICLHLWANDDAVLGNVVKDARDFRFGIWTEHLGKKFLAATCAAPATPACIVLVRDAAAENYKAFREGRNDPAVHGHLCLWPLEFTDASPVKAVSKAPELDSMIPDRPFGLKGSDLDAWRWHAPGRWVTPVGELTGTLFPANEIAE